MARPLRLEFAGAFYHLTARGNARADIFMDDHDRRLFLELLGKEIFQQSWRCHAYCLMNNHYHLLIETTEPNLVSGMRRLNGVYSQRFNRRHGRVGHVLQGRYKSILVETDAYGLELSRYIVLNPVRAKIVELPQYWPWSSYRATVGEVELPPWLDAAWVLGQFGGHDPATAYKRFVHQPIELRTPWDKVNGQIWLGADEFLQRMESLIEGKSVANVSQMHRRPARPNAERVTARVLSIYRIKDEATLRSRRHQEAFQSWVYLLRRACNLSLRQVATRCEVSPSRISQIQRKIETGVASVALQELRAQCKVKN